MDIISYNKIRAFCKKHPEAANPLEHWYRIVKHENFRIFTEVKQLFPSADLVGNFIVFNIGGNDYRLIAYIRYKFKRLFIRHILTHRQYEKNKWKEDK